MDDFFQKLRKIQKKERANSTLARVGNDFYTRTNNYIDELKTVVGNDPFSKEHYLLKDSQRIATEICERREHKIADAAIMNIHRSYHLFIKGQAQFDLLDTTPLNLTNEEEKLYFSIIDNLKGHRKNISMDKLSDSLKDKNGEIENEDNETEDYEDESEVLKRLNAIKKAKVITPEPKKHILTQIAKSKELDSAKEKTINSPTIETKEDQDKTDTSSTQPNKDTIKSKEKDPLKDNIDDQFVNLDEINYLDEIETPEKPKTRIKNNVKSCDIILLFDNLPAIVGVDKKIYGPFTKQDIITIPSINANILVKNRKARLLRI
ncbi:DNA replication complex subunit Gins51 [Methanobrevibacter filiformis]|uniref:Gins51 C-terminal domain-containing protein n=1 Tax=Methanobrevibacter filiformis TaxID=55758 RepID=A0A166A057_9EURY|nr:hypothetical protein [Methanobrevibacter filiformis]KZX11398.1 hypothetical protein MBFIL_14820 [Methanobrevibacter filiformis]